MADKTAGKLDMGRVWRDTLALLKSHWALLSTLAGALLFLPAAAGFLLFANADINWTSKNPVLVEQQMEAAFMTDGWLYAIMALVFVMGQLAMYILVLHQRRPTVGQAIGLAVMTLPSYMVAYFAIQFVLNAVPMATEGMAGVGPIVSGAFFVLSIIVGVHTFVMAPVFASGSTLNPLTNFLTSWTLTRGNALVVLALTVLMYCGLLVAGSAVWAFVSILISVVATAQSAVAGTMVALALVIAFAQLLIVGVAIAVYRQLVEIKATAQAA